MINGANFAEIMVSINVAVHTVVAYFLKKHLEKVEKLDEKIDNQNVKLENHEVRIVTLEKK